MAFDQQIATATVYMEARGDGPTGMLAVAWVLVNRWRSGRFGPTLAHVCLQASQFSCWNTSDPNRAGLANVSDADPTLQLAHSAVDDAINAAEPDPTDGALYYFADGIPPPYWAKAFTRTCKIGHQTFFKG